MGESAVLQVSQMLVPFQSAWMPSVAPDLIAALSVVEGMFEYSNHDGSERHYHVAIVERVRELEQQQGRRVSLAGHSLGGGLAKVVGALTKRPAVSLSGPGLAESVAKLGHIDNQLLNSLVVNVYPTGDLVPAIGRQAGMVVHTRCDAQPAMCHVPMLSIC